MSAPIQSAEQRLLSAIDRNDEDEVIDIVTTEEDGYAFRYLTAIVAMQSEIEREKKAASSTDIPSTSSVAKPSMEGMEMKYISVDEVHTLLPPFRSIPNVLPIWRKCLERCPWLFAHLNGMVHSEPKTIYSCLHLLIRENAEVIFGIIENAQPGPAESFDDKLRHERLPIEPFSIESDGIVYSPISVPSTASEVLIASIATFASKILIACIDIEWIEGAERAFQAIKSRGLKCIHSTVKKETRTGPKLHYIIQRTPLSILLFDESNIEVENPVRYMMETIRAAKAAFDADPSREDDSDAATIEEWRYRKILRITYYLPVETFGEGEMAISLASRECTYLFDDEGCILESGIIPFYPLPAFRAAYIEAIRLSPFRIDNIARYVWKKAKRYAHGNWYESHDFFVRAASMIVEMDVEAKHTREMIGFLRERIEKSNTIESESEDWYERRSAGCIEPKHPHFDRLFFNRLIRKRVPIATLYAIGSGDPTELSWPLLFQSIVSGVFAAVIEGGESIDQYSGVLKLIAEQDEMIRMCVAARILRQATIYEGVFEGVSSVERRLIDAIHPNVEEKFYVPIEWINKLDDSSHFFRRPDLFDPISLSRMVFCQGDLQMERYLGDGLAWRPLYPATIRLFDKVYHDDGIVDDLFARIDMYVRLEHVIKWWRRFLPFIEALPKRIIEEGSMDERGWIYNRVDIEIFADAVEMGQYIDDDGTIHPIDWDTMEDGILRRLASRPEYLRAARRTRVLHGARREEDYSTVHREVEYRSVSAERLDRVEKWLANH